jgi:hypothetical protein
MYARNTGIIEVAFSRTFNLGAKRIKDNIKCSLKDANASSLLLVYNIGR